MEQIINQQSSHPILNEREREREMGSRSPNILTIRSPDITQSSSVWLPTLIISMNEDDNTHNTMTLGSAQTQTA